MGKRLKLSNEEVLASYLGMKLPTHEQNFAMMLEGQALLSKLANIMSEHELVGNDLELEQVLTADALH